MSLSPLNVLHPQRDSKRKGSTYSSRLERQPWTGDHAFTLNKTLQGTSLHQNPAAQGIPFNSVSFILKCLALTCNTSNGGTVASFYLLIVLETVQFSYSFCSLRHQKYTIRPTAALVLSRLQMATTERELTPAARQQTLHKPYEA